MLTKFLRQSLFIVALLAGHITFCQTKDTIPTDWGIQKGTFIKVSKKNLEEIIRNSINQPEKGKISFPSNPWTTCNQDSAFFKLDTLYFCTTSYYYQQNSNCCQFISWTFYDDNSFIRVEDQNCKEPSSAKAYKSDDNFKFQLIEQSNQVFIQTFIDKKPVDNFKILSIERLKKSNNDGEFDKVTLVRQK